MSRLKLISTTGVNCVNEPSLLIFILEYHLIHHVYIFQSHYSYLLDIESKFYYDLDLHNAKIAMWYIHIRDWKINVSFKKACRIYVWNYLVYVRSIFYEISRGSFVWNAKQPNIILAQASKYLFLAWLASLYDTPHFTRITPVCRLRPFWS